MLMMRKQKFGINLNFLVLSFSFSYLLDVFLVMIMKTTLVIAFVLMKKII